MVRSISLNRIRPRTAGGSTTTSTLADYRTTALAVSSIFGRAANSATVIGFTGAQIEYRHRAHRARAPHPRGHLRQQGRRDPRRGRSGRRGLGHDRAHGGKRLLDSFNADIQMGDRPQRTTREPAPCARHGAAVPQESPRVYAAVSKLEHHDVGLDPTGIELDARNSGQALRQPARVPMVLGQPLDVVLEGADPRPRRCRPAASRRPSAASSAKPPRSARATPANTAPTGAPSPLREVDPGGVEALLPSAR